MFIDVRDQLLKISGDLEIKKLVKKVVETKGSSNLSLRDVIELYEQSKLFSFLENLCGKLAHKDMVQMMTAMICRSHDFAANVLQNIKTTEFRFSSKTVQIAMGSHLDYSPV
jgi:hypothetical protein